VSKSETIAKLEALLARVRSRAGELRRPTQVAVAAVPSRGEGPTPSEPPFVDEATIPPPPGAPVRAVFPTEADLVMDVDMLLDASGETVIDVTTEEVGRVDHQAQPPEGQLVIADSLESRERLVAAEPIGQVVAEVPSPESVDESPPEVLVAVDEVEEVEEPPLSSRRPVALQHEERLADMAFGSEEPRPPRHTPPPESGRLPAAPALEFDGDVTGVREASSHAPRRPEATEASIKSPAAEPSRSRELVPQVTRAEFAPSDVVADVVGEAQRFAPSTFIALLDASLAL
jgi:hypothetical protein